MTGEDDPADPTPWDKRPPYLQRWIDTRNGRERVYFRKPGAAKIELTQPWGSLALADAVKALTDAAPEKPKADDVTLVGAVRAYRGDHRRNVPASAEYQVLTPSVRAKYDRWLDEFEVKFVDLMLEDVTPAFVLDLRDKWAGRGHEAANTALQVLKNVCRRPRIAGTLSGDPFTLIKKVPRPHGRGPRNPSAEDSEVEALIATAIARRQPGLARAIALARWGGFRRGTICRVPLRARIQRPTKSGALERRILWVTEKKEVLCDRREDIRLTELLARTPNNALTIAYNAYGRPWKERALNQAFDRLVADLSSTGEGRTPLVRPVLTVHGLRHARGLELAYSGGSDAEIMAQLDHATSAAAKEYRAQADRLRLADAAQDRVDAQIIALRAATAKRGQSDSG